MPGLTTDDVNELEILLAEGNRGQFYWRYKKRGRIYF